MLVQDLHLILKVAELKSIKQAADSLDIHVATASAAIKRVEQHYGIAFFIRTTRNLRVSPAGEKYIPQIEQALETLAHIGQHAKADTNTVDGELRMSVPSDIGRNIILPWMDEFMAQHPALSIRMHFSDSNIDFYREPADLALRYGKPKDSSLYGFKIADVPRLICASPAYLAQSTPIREPADLVQHNGLLYQVRDIVYDRWEVMKDGTRYPVKLTSNRIANDAEIVHRWCVSGKGIALKSALDLSEDLLSGKLVQVLPDYPVPPTEFWLMCPSRQLITPAVRLLRDMIKERCIGVLRDLQEVGISV